MATAADLHSQLYTHMLSDKRRGPLTAAADAPGNNPVWRVGGWTSYSGNNVGIEHSTNALHILLALSQDIQEKWLVTARDNQAINNNLTLTAYKYDDLKTNNEFIGFYFLKINAGSVSLYCRVGIKRQEYNPPKLCKLSSNEKDIYS